MPCCFWAWKIYANIGCWSFVTAFSQKQVHIALINVHGKEKNKYFPGVISTLGEAVTKVSPKSITQLKGLTGWKKGEKDDRNASLEKAEH